MPTYRYRCQECGEEFDVWQSIKDDALHTHDDGCGGELAKVFSAAGIVLKGSGFYRNDSRAAGRPGAPKEKESANGGASSEPSKHTTDGEKAPATKSGTDSTSSDSKSGSSTAAGTTSS